MRARLVTRDGRTAVLEDVRFDGPLVTGTTGGGRKLVLRQFELVNQRLPENTSDNPEEVADERRDDELRGD